VEPIVREEEVEARWVDCAFLVTSPCLRKLSASSCSPTAAAAAGTALVTASWPPSSTRPARDVLVRLLTSEEELDRGKVFDIELLSGRLVGATRWLGSQPGTDGLPVSYFGASTGAAAALWAAAEVDLGITAVGLSWRTS